ncbi:ABC transporter ATP-binding protein [Bifidobacterium apri]|uniref:Macrolide ABC transporter ATP-binding protein n=1 Tax=Bifidobacterium apri TaxID=1769423 RepID=A0A6A2W3P7_9BIFI|nr:ABC transporter ATP-binding protein [Bifidobacterium apri]KAB8299474.1 macrolide ABC transporter ATP-binding protein [Bifidobacterium apri]
MKNTMVTPLIELEHVGRRYPGVVPTEALRDVSLSIMPGEFVAILGPSGAGKSTLLNILGMLDAPTCGTYRFNALRTDDMPERRKSQIRAQYIGFVFQAFHLLPYRSVEENVAMSGLYAGVAVQERMSRARRALSKVGLEHKANSGPLDLSGGERQRVAIARAICNNPRVVVCDEPTGNLDSQRAESIMEIFSNLNREGQTVVMVTHNEAQTRFAHRTIHMSDGMIIEDSAQSVSKGTDA